MWSLRSKSSGGVSTGTRSWPSPSCGRSSTTRDIQDFIVAHCHSPLLEPFDCNPTYRNAPEPEGVAKGLHAESLKHKRFANAKAADGALQPL